jgi:small subunit ribosomal protein S11
MSRKKRLQKKAEKGKKAEAKKQAYASRIAAKAKTKKKAKRTAETGRAYIKSTFNNTIITITDAKGDVLATSSAGKQGFKGSKKSTSYAASKAATDAAAKALNFGMKQIDIFVQGVGTGRDSAIRSLAHGGLEVMVLKDITPIPHNGPRVRRPRRV